MIARVLLSFALTGALLSGCSSLLFKSTPAPVYYQLEYEPVSVDCPKGFQKGVQIWGFGASSPYNQPDMVVIEKGQKVNYSGSYQWVASPGTLVANSLQRDLTEGPLFTQVVGSNSPLTPPLELTGHIFTFAWERTESGYRAHLYVETSLVDTSGRRKVILRKGYRFTSKPYQNDSPDNFAEAMSSVMQEFSKSFQEDLCKSVESTPKV